MITPETNIVMLDVSDASEVVAKLKERGVLMSQFTPTRVRAVTHLDVDEAKIIKAAEQLAQVMS